MSESGVWATDFPGVFELILGDNRVSFFYLLEAKLKHLAKETFYGCIRIQSQSGPEIDGRNIGANRSRKTSDWIGGRSHSRVPTLHW